MSGRQAKPFRFIFVNDDVFMYRTKSHANEKERIVLALTRNEKEMVTTAHLKSSILFNRRNRLSARKCQALRKNEYMPGRGGLAFGPRCIPGTPMSLEQVCRSCLLS
jgi:hypothetical protein